ncbi:MAG: hypothetical protein ACERLG_13315, partial [Sedimentibacter sp.]
MIPIEEVEIILDEIAEGFPKEFYKDLNGGIILLPGKKMHEKSMNNDLYILGEYHYDRNLGRFISVYYGSVSKVYGNLSKNELKSQLEIIVKHEFRHHLESMSGE